MPEKRAQGYFRRTKGYAAAVFRALTWVLCPLIAACAAPVTPPRSAPDLGPCDDFELDARRVWNDELASAVGASFSKWGASFAQKTAEQVVTRMDGFTRDWINMSKRACVDTVVRKVMQKDTYVALSACYDTALTRQRAFVELFAKAEPQYY
jgi:hypothetical protein